MTAVRRTSFVMALLLGLPVSLLPQSSAVVDEGTFMVTQGGTPLGRESFRIVRAPAPGGQVYKAQGQSALGDYRATTSLGTDSSGVPVLYEATLTKKTEVVQRLQGRGRPGRFSVLKQTRTGESVREYVLNGALLMEEDVFHHFFFVPIASQSELIVITPRSAQQGRFRVEQRGVENVEIAGRSIPGRRYALIDDSDVSRDVWVDEKGRLLKVAIPAKGLVALRDDPPR